MSAEILNYIPISGELPEKHFGDEFNLPLWIKFTDNNFRDWAGCFPRLNEKFNKVLVNSTNETALVVSGDLCYLVDISTKELLYKSEEILLIESAIITSNPEYFLIGACYCIYVFDSSKLAHHLHPEFGTDGIYFTSQKGEKAIGHTYAYTIEHDNFIGFELDLKTFEIITNKKIKVPLNLSIEPDNNAYLSKNGGNIIYRLLKRWLGK